MMKYIAILLWFKKYLMNQRPNILIPISVHTVDIKYFSSNSDIRLAE